VQISPVFVADAFGLPDSSTFPISATTTSANHDLLDACLSKTILQYPSLQFTFLP
jgi:hypothetical protein